MADTKPSFQKEELWPSIISITVPLVQLVSVVVIGLSDTFHIAQLLVFPEILNLINLLTMLVTISAIGWFWYWRTNINWVAPLFDAQAKVYTPHQKIIEKLNRRLIIASAFVLLVFIFTTMAGYLNLWSNLKVLWGTLQYLTYSSLLILSGVAIYIWIYEFIQKKQTFQREDFTRNLITTLSDQGLIPRPNLKILRNQNTQGASRVVEIEIDSKKLILSASFDGLEINEVYEKDEYEKLLQRPSVEQLQAQITALLAQIQQLQSDLE